MKKKQKRKTGSHGVSRAFVALTSDYISMAKDVDTAQNYAYLAVIAWNISLYPQNQITEKIDLVAHEYEKSNPGIIQAELLSHDLQRLVDKKLKNFSHLKRTITKIGVEEQGEEYKIITESVPFELQ